jgi:excisionase family DNA binding protein
MQNTENTEIMKATEKILKETTLLTIPETAALMRVEEPTIRNMIERDQIPYVRLPNGDRQGWLRIPKEILLGKIILRIPRESSEKEQ